MKISKIKQINIHKSNCMRVESSCALISEFHARAIENALEKMSREQKVEVIDKIIFNLKENKLQQ